MKLARRGGAGGLGPSPSLQKGGTGWSRGEGQSWETSAAAAQALLLARRTVLRAEVGGFESHLHGHSMC